VEALEDRVLPAPLAAPLLFDPTTGQLAIHAAAAGDTVREAVTAAGALEVRLGGQLHSSDPASAAFDPALAGAGRGHLAAVRFDGQAADTLVLGPQSLPGGLRVTAAGAQVVTEDVTVAGALDITAAGITVRGALHAAAATLGSAR
jgi:hypothetical protein